MWEQVFHWARSTYGQRRTFSFWSPSLGPTSTTLTKPGRPAICKKKDNFNSQNIHNHRPEVLAVPWVCKNKKRFHYDYHHCTTLPFSSGFFMYQIWGSVWNTPAISWSCQFCYFLLLLLYQSTCVKEQSNQNSMIMMTSKCSYNSLILQSQTMQISSILSCEHVSSF